MKKALLFLSIIFTGIQSFSQAPSLKGNPITEIFTDFHYNTGPDTVKTTGFALNRAYFGYNFLPGGNFSGTLIVNVGNPRDLSINEKQRRYAFFREASMTYTGEKLTMSFGMTSTRSTMIQQKFVGKRYIAESFENVNSYTNVADLGFSADYKVNDIIQLDLTVMNGEGYHSLHVDNSIKTSLGVNITPEKSILIRLYGDLDRPSGIRQNTLIGFLGYKNEAFALGLETAYKTNVDKTRSHDGWGLSATGAVTVTDKTELFGRYDYVTSTKDAELYPEGWNYKTDGQYAVLGFQYTYNQYFRIALDYQGTFPYTASIKDSNGIFVNAHFKF
jgi:hypothetical protein